MPLPTGQLTRHDSATQNKSFTYSYDEAGKLLTKRTYAYTTGTLGSSTDSVTYACSSGTWGDLLTACCAHVPFVSNKTK